MDSKNLTAKALIALQYVDELGYKKKAALLGLIKDPSVLPSEKSLVRKVLGDSQAEEFFKNYAAVDGIIETMERKNVHWTVYTDDDYPEFLYNLEDRPHVLFVKGNFEALKRDCIGIVGSRRPTHYGEKVAEEFSREFANAGLTVVSGFARGIDGIAHKACVACAKPTVAVFACGIDVCYPAEHRGLAEGILLNGGALVSEYPLGTKPLQYHFPERNRIISGLSRAVFLAQAAKKSGSLITVRFAIEQGKEVFAVPGNIYAAESEGANELLREIPDALVISPEDVLDALHVKREYVEKHTVELTLCESQIVEALHDGEAHFEELLAVTGMGVGDLTNALFNLELNGMIQNTGGNYYSLAGM